MIVHRCECGHPDLWHGTGDEGPRTSRCAPECGCGTPSYGPPEVIPSWQGGAEPTRLDPTVIEPGTDLPGLPVLCDCEQCQALYAQQEKGAA